MPKRNNPFENAFKLIEILASKNAEARIVGGAVRDYLSNLEVKDIDMAINVPPEETQKILNELKIKNIPTGIDYGTITAIYNDQAIEITSLRKDIETDGRRAVVSYSKDWEQDAKRRDFTINALYMDKDYNIYDYFNCSDDLRLKKLRFIGDAEERITEDYLRILRLFRFSAYLDSVNFEEAEIEKCYKLKSGLEKISEERIGQELRKFFSYHSCKKTLKIKYVKEIIAQATNLSESADLKSLDRYISISDSGTGDLKYLISMALYFNLDAKKLDQLFASLKLSKKEKNYISNLLKYSSVDLTNKIQSLNKIIRWEGKDFCKDLMAYIYSKTYDDNFSSNYQDSIKYISDFKIKEFPVNGNDLIKLGFKGNKIGETLNLLEDFWEENNYQKDKEELIDHAKANIQA